MSSFRGLNQGFTRRQRADRSMTRKKKIIFFFLVIFSLAFDFYCENVTDKYAREEKERRQYCDNARKELHEITRPKLRETYERYYRQGSCTEDSDCVGIDSWRNCYGNGKGTGCEEIFYGNLEEQFRSETHDMNEKCKSDYYSCRYYWPSDPFSFCFALSVRCVDNQCKSVNMFFQGHF